MLKDLVSEHLRTMDSSVPDLPEGFTPLLGRLLCGCDCECNGAQSTPSGVSCRRVERAILDLQNSIPITAEEVGKEEQRQGCHESFATHEARAKKLREAIRRVVLALEIGPDGLDLAAAMHDATPGMGRQESLEAEERFIDDLVLAVGEVLTREDQ